MAFRKRNAPLASLPNRSPPGTSLASPGLRPEAESLPQADELPSSSRSAQLPPATASLPLGVRPSPLDGRPTTSTGTQSLDALLAGHAGLALGNSLLIEEEGTTDYAGSLLRFYAAEGVVQGHQVHVLGMGEQWGRELPGLIGIAGEDIKSGKELEEEAKMKKEQDKMKIAWRYERLGQFGEKPGGEPSSRVPARSPSSALFSPASDQPPAAFCHAFDLTKRLTLPSPKSVNYIPLARMSSTKTTNSLAHVIEALSRALASTPSSIVHRFLIPILLSPVLYSSTACDPQALLPFLHSLRALLRRFPTRLTAVLTLPLSLYPRSSGLTRWIELLSDGVIELLPFPHTVDAGPPLASSGAATKEEEKPLGMVKIHRLPIFHERGGGGSGSGVGDDLAFTVSRRRFIIKPFSLPPIQGDREAQRGNEGGSEKGGRESIDF